MPVPEKLKDSLAALKRKVNQESELFTALNNLSAKNSTASSPVTTIDEDEIMEVIGNWDPKASPETAGREFTLLAMIPGMLALLIENQRIAGNLITAINQIAAQYFAGIFAVVIKALWGDESAPRQANKAEVDWLVSLSSFRRLQFLAPSEADQNLESMMNVKDAYVFEMLLTEGYLNGRQRGNLFSAMTVLNKYNENANAIIALLFQQPDFNLSDCYDNASEPFKNLAQVKEKMDNAQTFQKQQLEYLFSNDRTEKELASAEQKSAKILDADTLIAELNAKYMDNIAGLAKDNLSTVDHKRMKRLYDLLKQLSPEHQEQLANNDLSLAIAKCARDTYENRNSMIAMFGNSQIKRNFWNIIIADFSNKMANGFEVESEDVIKKAHTEIVKPKTPADKEAVNVWLRDVILDGYKTKEVIAWLNEDYLLNLAKDYPALTGSVSTQENVAENTTEEAPLSIIDLTLNQKEVEESTEVNASVASEEVVVKSSNKRASVRVSLALDAAQIRKLEEQKKAKSEPEVDAYEEFASSGKRRSGNGGWGVPGLSNWGATAAAAKQDGDKPKASIFGFGRK